MRPSTQGYHEQAADLVARYEAISFEDGHQGILDLVPPPPCRVLDIGAGSGRDAARFAECGDRVTAVEPTAEMRERGQALHPSPRIILMRQPPPRVFVGRGSCRYWAFMPAAIVGNGPTLPSARTPAVQEKARLLRGGLD